MNIYLAAVLILAGLLTGYYLTTLQSEKTATVVVDRWPYYWWYPGYPWGWNGWGRWGYRSYDYGRYRRPHRPIPHGPRPHRGGPSGPVPRPPRRR
jgi:hypothetical protein